MNAHAHFVASDAPLQAMVAKPSRLVWLDAIPGERTAVQVRSVDTGGAFSIIESVISPRAASPIHYHDVDEVFFVIEGTVVFELDGKIHDATPGTTVFIPAGMAHGWRNRSLSPTRLLATFSPGGMDRFFEQLAGKSMDEIVRLAASHGTYVVGAPMS